MAIVTDDFNRAVLGSNWTQALGTVVIDSGIRATGGATGDCHAFYNAASFGAAQYAQAVAVAVSSSWIGVIVRAAVNNFYAFYGDAGSWELWRFVSGSGTMLAAGPWTLAVGDVIRLEASGTTLVGKKNGFTVTTQTDSAHSTGAPGVGFWLDGVYYNYVDDWEGGDLYNELIDVDARFMRTHPVYRM